MTDDGRLRKGLADLYRLEGRNSAVSEIVEWLRSGLSGIDPAEAAKVANALETWQCVRVGPSDEAKRCHDKEPG